MSNITPEVIAQRKATCLARYGVDHPMKVKAFRDKVKATNLKRYGVETPLVMEGFREKSQATLKAKYGVTHAMRSDSVKAGMRKRHLEKYGVENPSQRAEVMDKIFESSHRWKHVVVNGKKFKVQGYEEHAIRVLVDAGIPVSAISSNRRAFKRKDGGVYFPDLCVTDEYGDRTGIEVKSTYTSGKRHREMFKEVVAKANALMGKWYYFLIVINEDGTLHAHSALGAGDTMGRSLRETSRMPMKERVADLRKYFFLN